MLSEREKQVYAFIRDFNRRTNKVPSSRQICNQLGFKSSRSAQNYINSLKEKGLLVDREPETSSYLLADDAGRASGLHSVPVLGKIAAGFPAEAFPQPEQSIELPSAFFGEPHDEIFALQIVGNSMSGDFICEGDIAIIKKQSDAFASDAILAVRVGTDEFTLKRLHHKKNTIELVPSNPQYSVVEVPSENVTVIGKYLGLLRRT